MAATDVSQILQEAAQQAALNTEAIVQETSKSFAAATKASSAEQTAINAAAAAANEVNTATGRLVLAKEARNKAAAANFGTNMDAANFVGQSVAEKLMALTGELDQRHTELQQKMDLNFTDDPIGWIMNQFTLPGEVAAYNSLNTKRSEIGNTMKMLQDLTQEQVATNNAIAATTDESILAAQARGKLAEAQKLVADSQGRIAALGLNYGNIRLAQTREQFNLVATLDSHRMQEAQLALSQDNNALAKRRLELDVEMKNLQLEIRKENKDAEALFASKLQKVADTFGYRPISYQEFKMADPKTQAFWWELANNPLLEHGIAGKNTAEAVTLLAQQQAPLTPTTRPVMDTLMHIRQSVITKEGPMWKSYDEATRQVKIQEAIEAKTKMEYSNIPPSGSIFSPPPLQSVVTVPAVSATTIGKLMTPFATSPTVTTKPNDFFQVALKAVQDGKMPAEQAAAELSQIFTAVRIGNNQDRQYQKFALKPLDKFNATVDTGAMWQGKVTVDMTNAAAIKPVLLRALLQQRAEELASELAPFIGVPKGAM